MGPPQPTQGLPRPSPTLNSTVQAGWRTAARCPLNIHRNGIGLIQRFRRSYGHFEHPYAESTRPKEKGKARSEKLRIYPPTSIHFVVDRRVRSSSSPPGNSHPRRSHEKPVRIPLRQTLHRPRPTRTNPPPTLPSSITTYAILRARDAHTRLLSVAREL